MKCFYHRADLDGRCSGAIVKYAYPMCECIGIDYNEALNKDITAPGEDVFVVDFSFTRGEMDFLNTVTNLTWIDHHKSAFEKCEGLNIAGLREEGRAACELTWEYLCPEIPTPKAVHYLGRYDVWDHEDPGVIAFQYGMRNQVDTQPKSSLWDKLFERTSKYQLNEWAYAIQREGETILKYVTQQNALVAKGMSYEAEFHGFKAIVINRPYSNSKIFDSVYDPDEHDIMIIFGVKPGEIKYSLYCDKPEIDVSEIATQYGGGGHRGAAGFYSDKLLL